MHRTTNLLLAIFASVFLQVSAFSLYDAKTSYAKFPRWPANGGNRSRVSFRFKTYADAGLLFYIDDGGLKQYLTFYLRDGFLILEFHDGAKSFKASSGRALNDLRWYNVVFELDSRHAAYKIDGRSLADYKTNLLTLKSNVYVGGFPNFKDIADLAYFEAGFMRRFLGCVEEVRYGNGSMNNNAIIVASEGLSEKCQDACKPRNPCKNRGVCVNRFAVAECMCTGTGYTGDTCQEESAVVGIPTVYDRVIIEVPSVAVSRLQTTSILIRFRSAQPDGVFFYTADNGDYILLELTNGNIATTVNLGSGSVTITTKNVGYNDNQWHVVQLNRVKRIVNVTVDASATLKGVTRGKFTGFSSSASKTSVSLGGLSDTHLRLRSVSRRNFTGCLQELIFNDYELFSKLNAKTSDVRSRGTIIPTCPEANISTRAVTQRKSTSETPTSGPWSTSFEFSTKPTVGSTTRGSTTSFHVLSTTFFHVLSTTFSHVLSTTPQISNPTVTHPPCPPDTLCSSSSPTTPRDFSSVSSNTPSKDSRSTFVPSSDTDDQVRSQYDRQTTEAVTERQTSSIDDRRVRNTVPTRFLTDGIIMATKNERSANEADLTLWFVLAAAVGIVAFLLVLVIIIKVHSTNRKKYQIKETRMGLNGANGSFQLSSNESKNLV